MTETLKLIRYEEPFPHIIVKNFYNEEELELIWEELNFYTKPGKLMKAGDFGGIVGYTNSSASFLINCIETILQENIMVSMAIQTLDRCLIS